MDADWTEAQAFGRGMGRGTLVTYVAVGATACDVNPRAMSYGFDRVRFDKPVYIGDTITTTAEIVEVADRAKHPRESGFACEMTAVRNQRRETVLVLTHIYLVNKRLEAQ